MQESLHKTKMNRSEKALKLYIEQGFNCAQSVIVSFSDILDLSEEQAIRVASGFGGGMGRTQSTCGAATGAFMVIGFLRSQINSDKEISNEESTQLVQEFSNRFAQIHGTTNCKALIKYDLNSEKELKEAKEADVFNKKCTFFVQSAVEILEDILNKKGA